MFGSIWSFVKRHRRKFIFTGLIVGGSFCLGRYAHRKLREFQEKEATECLTYFRRQHHFDSNQRTCNMTVLSMLPCLRESLCKKLNSESLTNQLRLKPANKLEIWEELKIISFTRTIVAVYGCCMLVVFLRVQLNILGGYMYIDSQQNNDDETSFNIQPTVNADIQKRYLAGIQYVFEEGLDNLIRDVESAVKSIMAAFSLKDRVTTVTVQDIVIGVRKQIEGRPQNGYHDVVKTTLIPYMMSSSDNNEARGLSQDEIAVNRLNNETLDMIESSDFHTVMTVCLDSGFTRLVDKVGEYFTPTASSSHPQSALADENVATVLPLAKVIPIVNGLVHTVLSDSPNPFLQDLLLKEQVKNFAANVYEAFGQLHENKCGIN